MPPNILDILSTYCISMWVYILQLFQNFQNCFLSKLFYIAEVSQKNLMMEKLVHKEGCYELR